MRIILRIAFRNLRRHLRKTLLLAFLIAVGIGLLFVANAFFASSNRGLQAAYVGSLTGDGVISYRSASGYGLFGSEVPIVSEYETIPSLSEFERLRSLLSSEPLVRAWTPLVSVAAKMQVEGFSQNVPVFGVDAASYFTVCSDLVVVRGDPRELASGGVFINEALAQKMEATLGRVLASRDQISFSCYSGGSFRIRKGHFAGIFRYPARTEVLDRVVLTDPTLARSLARYTLGYVSSAAATTHASSPEDIDSLFTTSADTEGTASPGISLGAVEATLGDTQARDSLVLTDQAAWSFVLVSGSSPGQSRLLSTLEARIGEASIEARVMDWRSAAGTSAQALFALQAVFYIALAFIALGAILVIMNSLVISVLEREAEIGTMRSLGASVSFIRSQFIVESMALTLFGALLGVLGGIAVCLAIGRQGFTVSNGMLITLFGGAKIVPIITASSVFLHFGLALVIGSLSWIYPVSVALRIQPATAMAR